MSIRRGSSLKDTRLFASGAAGGFRQFATTACSLGHEPCEDL